MQTPPQAPTAPVTAAPSITIVGPDGKTQTLTIPKTRSEIRDLIRQRESLSDQLTNVSERRSAISNELQGTGDPIARTGLEQRISLLDKRILQLETDLANTGRQLSAAPAELVSTGEAGSAPSGSDFDEGVAAGGFSVFFVCAIAFVFARRRWNRKTRPTQPQLGSEAVQRLERLEHGMEAIAIEIERVSEGQRFVTKLLSARPESVEASSARSPSGSRIS
jgi:hypothetical protein